MLDVAPIYYHPESSKDANNNNSLYLFQHQVIELVEVAPPPPRQLSTVFASSSYASSDSDDYDDDDEEIVEEEEMEEEDAVSYCSSDDLPNPQETPTKASSPDSHTKRILLWRESALSVDSPSSSLKRKLDDFDSSAASSVPESHSSKRSRSSLSSSSSHSSASSQQHFFAPQPEALASRRYSIASSITSAELDMHPCPACDAFFPTLASLRAHGKAQGGSEACSVAVEYAFE